MNTLLMKLAAPALCLTLGAGCSADATPAMPGYAPAETGAAVQASAAEDTRCEIRVASQGRMLVVESWVHASQPASGRASIRIEGIGRAGSTNVAQSAGFTAAPGEPALVGRSMVMGGALYDVSLSATIDGRTVDCTERVGDMT